MFKVVTRNYAQEFERWTDALEAANALKPQCKSLLQDIRVFDGEELVWIYSRSHRYPQYIGAGTYDRLARLFIFETMLEEELKAGETGPEGDEAAATEATATETTTGTQEDKTED